MLLACLQIIGKPKMGPPIEVDRQVKEKKDETQKDLTSLCGHLAIFRHLGI